MAASETGSKQAEKTRSFSPPKMQVFGSLKAARSARSSALPSHHHPLILHTSDPLLTLLLSLPQPAFLLASLIAPSAALPSRPPNSCSRSSPAAPFFLPSLFFLPILRTTSSQQPEDNRQLQRSTSALHICTSGLGHHAEARALKLQRNLPIFSQILPEISSFPTSAQNPGEFGSSCAKPHCLLCQPVLSHCFFVLFYPTDCLHLLSLASQLSCELSEARAVFSRCVFVAPSKRRSSFKTEIPRCFCRTTSDSFNKGKYYTSI